jgi:hypothetical protein
MHGALFGLVWRRAKGRCEYCQMPSDWNATAFAFQIDHVVAQKHSGPTVADNLALACFHCNNRKGPNIAGIDPVSGQIVPLYHPRRQSWDDHFLWDGPILVGLTATGRATIEVLVINHPSIVAIREALMDEGVFPPAPQ